MKAMLGMYVTNKLSQGFGIYTPPFSLILNGTDIIFTYLLSLIVDKIAIKKISLLIQYLLFPPIYYLTIKSYIIYLYFHGFVNYGLDKFLGSKGNETLNFIWYALDIYGFIFLGTVLFLTLTYLLFFKKLSNYLFNLKKIPFLIFIIGIIFSIFSYNISKKYQNKLNLNPELEELTSYLTMPSMIKPQNIENFKTPKHLLFGIEKTNLKLKKEKLNIKNIIVLFIESLPIKQTALNNKKSPFTILNEFQSNSIIFNNYRTFFPGTTRSMIGAMCGSYSGTNFSSITNYNPEFKCISIMNILKQNHYKTGFFSSVSMDYDNLNKASFFKDFDKITDATTLRKKYTPQKKYGTGNAVEEELAVKELMKFIKNNKPFFAFYYLYWTHSPYENPFKNNSGKTTMQRYRSSQKYINSVIKKLITQIKKENLLENTAIIITADHGEAFGEHQNNFTHGNYLYEESINIPLEIYLPKQITKKTLNNRNGSHIDLAPTILDLLNISPPEFWQGQSLISDKYKEKPQLIFARAINFQNGIIDGNIKYFYDKTTKKSYMFNLSKDKKEKNNIAKSNIKKVKKYKKIIEKWLYFQQKRINSKK